MVTKSFKLLSFLKGFTKVAHSLSYLAFYNPLVPTQIWHVFNAAFNLPRKQTIRKKAEYTIQLQKNSVYHTNNYHKIKIT